MTTDSWAAPPISQFSEPGLETENLFLTSPRVMAVMLAHGPNF